jgi:hypothetical protein
MKEKALKEDRALRASKPSLELLSKIFQKIPLVSQQIY